MCYTFDISDSVSFVTLFFSLLVACDAVFQVACDVRPSDPKTLSHPKPPQNPKRYLKPSALSGLQDDETH